MIKNNIQDGQIYDLVQESDISLDFEDYNKPELIEKMDKILKLYLAIEFFSPLHLIFF